MVGKAVDAKLQKTADSFKTVTDSLGERVEKNSTRIDDITQRVDALQIASQPHSQPAQEINEDENEISQLRSKLTELEDTVKQHTQKIKEQADQLESYKLQTDKTFEKLETHSRKLNLVFENVPETEGENCMRVVENIIRSEMKIKMQDPIDVAHRLGKSTDTQPAGIIARFKIVADKSRVLQNGSALKNTDYIARSDYPRSVMQRRSFLAKVLRDARKVDKTARIAYDKLHYNGNVYTVETVHTAGIPTHNHMLETENQIRFFGYMSFLSNFHRCDIKLNGTHFTTAEQAYHILRARYRHEGGLARRILNTNNPAVVKSLSRALNRSHAGDENRDLEIMQTVVDAKFSQNPDLKGLLLATENKNLIECNPHDRLYSCGLRIDDESHDEESVAYPGQNRLGQMLENTRALLQ